MIIAIKEKDKVVVGCSITDTWSRLSDEDYTDRENIPVVFAKDGTMLVCARPTRSADMLLYDDEFVEQEFNPKTIINNIIPHIRKKYVENGKVLFDKKRWDNALVICKGDKIYGVDTSLAFYETDDYVCHAGPVENMKSVLDETKHLSAKERIIKALSITGREFKEDFFPLVIVNSKKQKFTVINGGK